MKAIKLTSLLALLALILAGCGASVPGAEQPTSAPAAPAATEAPAAPAATEAPAAAKAPQDMKILVSMKGPGGGNPFWAAVEAGALEAAEATGAQVTVLAPPAESDVAAQIAQVEDQLAKGLDGIAIAPTDPAALAPVLDKAMEQGVKVVFIDTKGENAGVTFIGTDNEAGAALAAQYMCDNLEPGSEVAILQGIVTQSTGKARADGAKGGLESCGLTVVAEVPGEWDKAKGQAAMEDILTKNPNLQGVFGSNDNMALGAVEAIKNAGVGDLLVVGFDANPDAAAAILAGDMDATVAQAPSNMGKLGVESLIQLIEGETLDPIIDTGTELVTSENAAEFE